MLKPLDFFRTHITQGLSPEQDYIWLPTNRVKDLDAVGVGNHTYLTLRSGKFNEVVRYDHIEDFKTKRDKNRITVTRDILSSGRKTFPLGVCIGFEWFSVALSEWQAQEGN